MRVAGIGSRETPKHILELMKVISSSIVSNGGIIITGGADGADNAFEIGARESDISNIEKHLFVVIPWEGFNERYGKCIHNAQDFKPEIYKKSNELVDKFHNNPLSLSRGARSLMVRNSFQVLGASLNNPVDLVICWTKGGNLVGGTGQALRIAKYHNILIHNLADPLTYKKYTETLEMEF